MACAERVFDADSRSCLLQLRLLRDSGDAIEPAALAAASYLDILAAAGQLDVLRDWLARTDRTILDRQVLRQARELARLDGAESRLAGRPGGPEVLASWRRRATAIAAYQDVIDPAWSSANAAYLSLLRMHCNRLAGPGRAVEDLSLALARRLVKAHDGRLAALARTGAAP
jgi:thiopeptide-type bacteriocin biosynthesis protein